MWTRFMDMASGGSRKEEPYAHIYIEAPEDEAVRIFYSRFGHNPFRVSCTCCGEDYSVSNDADLAQLTGYDRGCDFHKNEVGEPHAAGGGRYIEQPRTGPMAGVHKFQTLAAHKKKADVLFIPASDIKPEERQGDVPKQGYVWQD